jgi:hypothetical protein
MERARGKQDGEESVWVCIVWLKTFTTNSCPPLRYSLQPERNCFTSYNTRKGLGSLSSCAIVLRSSPPSHVSTCSGQWSSQLFCVHYKHCSILTCICLLFFAGLRKTQTAPRRARTAGGTAMSRGSKGSVMILEWPETKMHNMQVIG